MGSQDNSHCCHRARQISPWAPAGDARSPMQLMDWFDDQMSRIQNDLVQHDFFDAPSIGRIVFDPRRRSRLFDALFSDDGGVANMELKFHENPNKNQIECQLSTGCGDFFRPEDIQLSVKDRKVEFTAKREQKSDDGHNYTVREVRRVFSVPEKADVEKLHAEMGPNGKVMLTAPLLKPKPIEKASDKPVPIKIKRG